MLPVVRPPCSRENAPLNACSTAVSRVRSSALLTLRRCKSSTEHTASWQIDPEAVPFPAGQLQTVNNSPVLGHKLVTTQANRCPLEHTTQPAAAALIFCGRRARWTGPEAG